MGKSTIIEQIIAKMVAEEVDKALSLSDKRRLDFKKSFDTSKEEPRLNLKDKQLKEGWASLIRAGVLPANRTPFYLKEADATTPPPADQGAPVADAAAPAPVPGATDPTGTAAAPGAGDPNAPATGADPALGGAPGAEGDASGGDPASPDGGGIDGADGGGDMGGDSGGGFGGFGGGGGGGGGGGDDTGAGEGDADPSAGGEPDMPEGDPIVAMVSGAQELLNQTQDPNLILKSLKGQIQTIFQEPEHALGLVKALYDTNDAILQAVAQRLYLFVKTK